VRKSSADTEGGEALAVDEAWYAIWTKSHCERLVADQLAAKGFITFLPEAGFHSKRRGVAHIVHLPMFPGYLFVRDAMDKTAYVEILKARGAVRILEDGCIFFTPTAATEIDAIRQIVEAGVPVMPHPHLHHGDRVRVDAGPLAGVEGIFIDDKPRRGRLVLSIALLGRSVSVEVDTVDITPCGRRSWN